MAAKIPAHFLLSPLLPTLELSVKGRQHLSSQGMTVQPMLSAHRDATLDAWIAVEAIPISLHSPVAFEAAVDEVMASLAGVELLGLGEALHGGEEILILRNRLFQRLAEAHGYSAIAIESSFSRARLVNDYVAGRGQSEYEDVQELGFSQGFGRLDANRELVEWIRKFNSDPLHRVKLQFYGFDMPGVQAGPASPRGVLDFVLDYLASIDASCAGEHRRRIDPLLGQDSRWEDPMAWRDPARSAELLSAAAGLRMETEELISKLQIRRPELVAKGGQGCYCEAVHNASLARQLLNFFAALARESSYIGSLAVRDALMADNLTYIVERERGRGKVLVFAHNAHMQRGMAKVQIGTQACTWWPAGSHLNEILGTRYAAIGTAVGVSDANGIGWPEAATLEARLTAVPGPCRFIPTHKGRGLPPSAIAALPPRSGSLRNPTYLPLAPQSLADFDWLAVLDSVAYSRGGPLLQ
jgi:erythromycin esterase